VIVTLVPPLSGPVLGDSAVTAIRVKLAVTTWAWLIVTVQVPVPEHPAALQPAKLDPAAAEAFSVTVLPPAKLAEHRLAFEPHTMPAGVLVTSPAPLPIAATPSVKLICAKLAVTLCDWFTVTAQIPVPEHGPLQPVKVEKAAGVALRVSGVPLGKPDVH
jgi:hypothetical protein